MADLQNSFNTVTSIVAITPLTKQERISAEEALKVLVTELNAYDALKKSLKPKAKPEKIEEVPDEKSVE